MSMTLYTMRRNADGSIVFEPYNDAPQKMIQVPYLSQLGSTAGYAPGDCGAACLAMLINWKGRSITVDEVSRATGQAPGYKFLSFQSMINTAKQFNLELQYSGGLPDTGFEEELNADHPVIALLNYQSIPSVLRRELNYNAGHWILVVGYDSGAVFYHDPYWTDSATGANKRMLWPDFLRAFHTIAPGNNLASHALVLK